MAEPIEEIDNQEEDGEGGGKKQRNSIISLIINILKYLLLVIVLGLFVVVITIITNKALQGQSRIENDDQLSIEIQQSVPEELDWYSTLGEIRGNLLDENTVTFIVDIYIGYAPGNQAVLQELTRRNVQIRERVSLYFASQYESDIEGARNFIRMKNELREIINRMMNNKVREVSFNALQIIPFQ